MRIKRKVSNWTAGKVHAVIADWTGATLCGIDIKEHQLTEVYNGDITCKRCLKIIAQYEGLRKGDL